MSAAACIDICAIDDESKYLILKDGRYVKIKCLRDKLPPDPESWPKLYDECQDGDHYMGYIRLKSLTSINDNVDARRRPKTRFYTIFRDRDYNLVKFHHRSGGTTTDKQGHQSHMHKYKLSDSYRGGDFYFSKGAEFYVVFKESRTFLRTVDLSEEPDMKQPLQLHNNLCNGLYYFATANFIYVVIAADNGFVYRRTPDLQTAGESAVSVHSSIAEVLKNGVPLQRRPWKSHGTYAIVIIL